MHHVAQAIQELKETIFSSVLTWSKGEPPDEVPEAKVYVGRGNGWTVKLFVYGEVLDGGAVNLRKGTAVHLTPEMTAKARELAEKAVG